MCYNSELIDNYLEELERYKIDLMEMENQEWIESFNLHHSDSMESLLWV